MKAVSFTITLYYEKYWIASCKIILKTGIELKFSDIVVDDQKDFSCSTKKWYNHM